MPIKEHDSVVLSRPLPEHGLQIGDVGAVVFVHRNNEAYEVEFIAGDGNTVGVVTLKPEDIRRLDASEILHARRILAERAMQSTHHKTENRSDESVVASRF